MEHIGIDLGSKHSHIVVMTGNAEVVLRAKVATAELPEWLSRRGPSRVVMEACTQSPAIARASQSAGHQTVVVPGKYVRMLGVGDRGIKTDERDAYALALSSVRNERLPSVHLRSEVSRSRREILATRALLLKARKSLSVSIKSSLRGRLISLKGRANTPAFCEAVRNALLEQEEGMSKATELLLETFAHLCAQIDALDETIEQLVEQDATCTRLMKIPGVGAQVSLALTTHIDDPLRFHDSEQLASYLALVPGEATTGGKVVRTGTIKAGPAYLKALLVQAAWSLFRARPNEPMVVWARGISDKRGKRIAIIALARKLATVMWAMWRHGTAYEPVRTNQVTMESSSSPSLLRASVR